jgi:O-methyltransferase involved in polyketide biosynthesis
LVSLFVQESEKKKTPEINRGYYVRTKEEEMFIDKFPKKSGNERQIDYLEYGFDTSYWRLKDSNKNVTDFVVMDFPSVTAQKCYLIKKKKKKY